MVRRRTRPLYPFLFRTVPPDSPIDRRQGSHLIENGLSAVVRQLRIAHTLCDFTQDHPIFPCPVGRLYRRADPLYTSLTVGEGTVLFRRHCCRQHHIGQLGRLAQERVLDYQEIEALQTFLYMIRIRVGKHRVLSDDVQATDFPCLRTVHHIQHGQTHITGQGNTPGVLKLQPILFHIHALVARVHVGQTTHVASSLHVGLTPQRVDATTGLAHITQEHLEVGTRQNVAMSRRMLGNPHRVEQGRRAVLGQDSGRGPNILRLDATDFGCPFRRVSGHTFFQFLKVLRPVRHKIVIVQVFGDKHVHNAIQQGNVRTGPLLDVQRGKVRDRDTTGITDDEWDAPLRDGLPEPHTKDRMVLGRVGTDNEIRFCFLNNIVKRIGHGT